MFKENFDNNRFTAGQESSTEDDDETCDYMDDDNDSRTDEDYVSPSKIMKSKEQD